MKIITLLILGLALSNCRTSSVSVNDHKQEIFIPFEYRRIQFSDEQENKIEKKEKELQNENISKTKKVIKLREYLYSVLTDEQIFIYNNKKERLAANMIKSKYSFLELNKIQEQDVIDYHLNLSDSISRGKKNWLTKLFVYKILSKEQLVLKEREETKRRNRLKEIAIKKDGNLETKAIFQQNKLSIIISYYHPRLLKISLDFKDKISSEDQEMIRKLQGIYNKKLEKVKKDKKQLYEAREDGKRAINHEIYYDNIIKTLSLKPDLCLYWCVLKFGIDYESKEEELINGLNLIKEKYPKLIAKALKKKLKLNKRLNNKLRKHEMKKVKKKGSVVTIVLSKEMEDVEEIVDFILVKT